MDLNITKHPPTRARLMQYIAVAAATLNCSTATEADRRMPRKHEELVNGFLAGGDPGSQERGVAIMDVLASICVSQARKEVFALGLQFNHKDGLLDILVAGNHDHNDSLRNVKEHLENVLRKVQELGNLYAVERNKNGGRNKVGDSPENEEHRIRQCVTELKVMIVRHSAAKVHRRIAKRWDDFTGLACDLHTYIKSKRNTARPGDEDDKHKKETQFLENLLQIACLVRRVYNTLGQKLMPEDINLVCRHLATAWVKFAVLRSASAIDVFRYVQRFSPGNYQFPLMHYLEKVLSVYVYVTTLVNWAQLPRLPASLCMRIRVQTLAASSLASNLPTTKDAWEAVLNELLETADVDPTHHSFFSKSANYAFSRYNLNRPQRFPVHCEVALVQHYHQEPFIVPPVHYIGVSKLSCLCCHLFLREYSKETKKTFKTRGTHSICYPWGFPELGTSDEALERRIQDKMANEIATHVARQWMKEGKVRSRTASNISGHRRKIGRNTRIVSKFRLLNS